MRVAPIQTNAAFTERLAGGPRKSQAVPKAAAPNASHGPTGKYGAIRPMRPNASEIRAGLDMARGGKGRGGII